MEREAQLVDAFQEDNWSTGVGGRLLDVLMRRNESVRAIGIDTKGPLIEGDPSLGRTVDVIPSGAVNTLTRISLTGTDDDLGSIEDVMKALNREQTLESGVFADFWSQNLIDVVNRTEELDAWINGVTLNNDALFRGSVVGSQLRMVAKMMVLNEARSVNRDMFLVHHGGHDAHSVVRNNLDRHLPKIDR